MLKKLDEIIKREEFLSQQLLNADVIADMSVWQKNSKEQSNLQPIVEKFDEYLKTEGDMKDAEEMLKNEKYADIWDYLFDINMFGKDK